MKQHIDSYNYFVNVDIKKIVKAKSNVEIISDVDTKFKWIYTDVNVGECSIQDDAYVSSTSE